MANETKAVGASRRASSEILADRRDKFVREHLEKERAASDVKKAKLRALRLAKEAADKDAQQGAEAENGDVKASAEPPPRRRVIRG